MNPKVNGANGGAHTPVSSMMAMMQVPAANGVVVSQKLAQETARFWARRMRAYIDQVETLAGCSSANQLIAAQAQFIERMQEDFAAETEALSEIWKNPNGGANGGERAV
ncbi:MAG TPA: phasin family protein [Caulobacterales bacterium]|nr:phasin family protein [Caulobacterales bacterium]